MKTIELEVAKKTQSALEVADYILLKASERDIAITPMKLQKLLYFAHGWMLGVYKRPLIKEQFEAWKHGPVVRTLFDTAKSYGSNYIDRLLVTTNTKELEGKIDKYEEKIIDFTIDMYGQFSALELSELTHRENTPWEFTYTMYGLNAKISNNQLEVYFDGLLKVYQESAYKDKLPN